MLGTQVLRAAIHQSRQELVACAHLRGRPRPRRRTFRCGEKNVAIPANCPKFQRRCSMAKSSDMGSSWDKNLIETTNPNAFCKSSRRRRVPTEQWQANRRCSIAVKATLAEHSRLPFFSDNCLGLFWHSCGILLWGTLIVCGTLLWDTLVRHSCLTLLLDTLVAHSGKTISLNTLKHSCKTLLLYTLAWHI